MSLWRWSRTAASNNTADSTINWREGMSPSAVNDSARAMMAAMAKYRDDVAGMVTTGGTSSAYTLTSYQTFTSLQDGIVVAFVPHATNAAGATLAVDGLTARNLRLETGVSLPASTLIAGTPYTATYDSANTEWLLHGYYSAPSNLPLGAILPYTALAAPNSNFVLCYGQAISRTTYATLYALLGTAYGVGDGSTTFNIPDLRGRVVAGFDSMGGSSANRLTGVSGGVDGDGLGNTGGSETHTLTEAQLAAHDHDATGLSGSAADHTHQFTYDTAQIAANNVTFPVSAIQTSGGATTVTTQGSGTVAVTITGDTADAGSGTAHNNVQPTIILPYIMRVL